jgi:glycerol kinase
VAYQTRDLLDAMAADQIRPAALKVDGGMAQNGLFLQRLADILNLPILRPKMSESTAFGAACLAGLGAGVYGSLNELSSLWKPDARCEPQIDSATRERDLKGWRAAVKRTLSPQTRP